MASLKKELFLEEVYLSEVEVEYGRKLEKERGESYCFLSEFCEFCRAIIILKLQTLLYLKAFFST
jgi:hypothetical protein